MRIEQLDNTASLTGFYMIVDTPDGTKKISIPALKDAMREEGE